MSVKEPWVPIGDVIDKTKDYIVKRMTGEIKSLRTGFPKLDSANIDGFEWGSTVTIGGRPSVGKTAWSSKLIHGAFESNQYDFEVLDFNWEMAATVLLIRELSASLRKSYKYVLSADNNTLSSQEMGEIDELLEHKFRNLPIHYVEQPKTPKEFASVVKRFIDKVQKPTLIRVDHTVLAKVSAQDGDRVTMLLNLMNEATEIKRESPTIFMFLTQLTRGFEDRQEDGTQNAFPRQGDCFAGDAAAQSSETMILLNKPSKYGIHYYGNTGEGVQVEPHDLFAHIVKNRNASADGIIRYKEHFNIMSMEEL